MKKIAVFVLLGSILSCSTDDSTPANTAPGSFAVQTEVQENSVTISWNASVDPEGDPVTYALMVNSETITNNLTTRSYQINDLKFSTSYNGSVTAKDKEGLSTSSDFSFMIGDLPNTPPSMVALLTPENNTLVTGDETTLSWEGATDAEGGVIRYNVYIKSGDDAFQLIADAIPDKELNLGISGVDRINEWYVEAIDEQDAKSTSETFSFRTLETIGVTSAKTEPPFADRDSHATIVFKNKLYIIGGGRSFGGNRYNDVWVSENGFDWTELTGGTRFTPRLWHSAVIFNDKIWIIGGNAAYQSGEELNDIWSSEDGDTWVQETANPNFAPRYGHRTLVYNGQLWLIGGRNVADSISREEVWKSSDGIHWTLVTDAGGFGTGNGFDAVVFKDRMWKIAGGNDSVYSSTDGENWVLETNEAAFGYRVQHSVASFDNKLWLFSGATRSGGAPVQEVWYSLDGKEWILANNNAGFQAANFTSTPFGNGIFVIGGATGGSGRAVVNDVYKITPSKFQE